ncbi:hypothetical protein HLB44_30400 [Aquincola sp. S2]|uniref:Uncharacterized protein n=1 Tax=Pseudaquabacterium terrae TaxID=2732868 RepID=A0ABX2ERN4_9BURK|nr:hypothetical protein [Aquabacterium terrae]NRF71311.1 hypothetical protein [Aquabacterium terrae]
MDLLAWVDDKTVYGALLLLWLIVAAMAFGWLANRWHLYVLHRNKYALALREGN